MVPAQGLVVERYQGTVTDVFATQVRFWNTKVYSWSIWRLIPVEVEGKFTPSWPSSEAPELGSLPQYDGDRTEHSTHARHAESERDDFSTIVTEVTTTLVTTRKRYRVEEP